MVEWFSSTGQPIARPGVPGESLSDFGSDPNGFNPFGMAFAPDGTLYFIDIHIVCSAGLQLWTAGLQRPADEGDLRRQPDAQPAGDGRRSLRLSHQCDHLRPQPRRGLPVPEPPHTLAHPGESFGGRMR